MQRHSDEDLFVRFQQRRDVDALAQLFRRRVDELLRLAVFLAPRPSEAEDLVQATFLSAIARAETYRSEHRVMSWLCGILTNHARMLRRAERRPQPQSRERAAEDPAAAALHAELRQTLTDSIRSLPEPYCSVLTLHLREGLDSVEISRRLSRPPATVRKQMERAIERLRTALPVGLATTLALPADAARLADGAAEAARFVEIDPLPASPAAGPAASTAGLVGPTRHWLPLLAACVVTSLLLFAWGQWFAGGQRPPVGSQPPTTGAPGTVLPDPEPPAMAHLPDVARPTATRQSRVADAGRQQLTVRVVDADGVAIAGETIYCIAHDGHTLPVRWQLGDRRAVATDAAGVATFAGLEPGRYDVVTAAAVPKQAVRIGGDPAKLTLRLPVRQRFRGRVVDPEGLPVAGAEVWVSESSARGDAGVVAASTGADGWFEFAGSFHTGRLWARHAAFAQSVGVRLDADTEHRLALEPASRWIDVQVVDARGAAAPRCYVALIPHSQSLDLFATFHACTDDDGRCRLPDPGAREATLLAMQPGAASVPMDLPPDARQATLRLAAGVPLAGVVVDDDGVPLPDVDVFATTEDLRTNEPANALLAQRARSDAEGRFAFEALPATTILLRVYGAGGDEHGPPMQQFVRAGATIRVGGADADADSAAPPFVRLVEPRRPRIEGSLCATDGSPLTGWHLLAVPATGTATHRMFRRRTAQVDAAGRFVLESVAADEAYELGVYAPGSWWPHELGWPTAFATARAGEAVELHIDPSPPATWLHCQALLPNGTPAAAASFELRSLAAPAPLLQQADHRGAARFGPLPPGDYWLVVQRQGIGSRTVEVHVAPGSSHCEVAPILLAPPAQVVVRLAGGNADAVAGALVVARNLPGDKFVTGVIDPRGQARLPPLPPGPSQLVVYGAGMAPACTERVLVSGPQFVDLVTLPAPTVWLRFPFLQHDNPFVIQGPLQVHIEGVDGAAGLDTYVGAAAGPGCFELRTGLAPGRYHVRARSIWNATGTADILIDASQGPVAVDVELGR